MLTWHSNPAEYAPIDDTYNPTIHRINQAIRHRAVHPEEGLQPPAEILLRYSKPPEALIEHIKKQTANLIKKADLKKGEFPRWKPSYDLPDYSHKSQYHPRSRASESAKPSSQYQVLTSMLFSASLSAPRSARRMPYQNSSRLWAQRRTTRLWRQQ